MIGQKECFIYALKRIKICIMKYFSVINFIKIIGIRTIMTKFKSNWLCHTWQPERCSTIS